MCSIDIIGYYTDSYPEGLKDALLAISEHGSVKEICQYNVLLGQLYAQSINKLMNQLNLKSEDILVIGSHGYVQP